MLRVLALAAAAVGVAACGPAIPTPTPVVLPVRTDATIHRKAGCEAFAVNRPVSGTLGVAELANGADAFLVSDASVIMHVVWPAGFTVITTVPAALLDDHGAALYRAGERVTLEQVSIGDHTGTDEDPYLAKGLFAGTCWGPGD